MTDDPEAGLRMRGVGVVAGATKVNRSAATVAEDPPGDATMTLIAPGLSAGEVAVMVVAESTAKWALAAPKSTLVVAVRSVPVMVTEVLPAVGPNGGLTAVTDGVASKVKRSAVSIADVPFAVVTVTLIVPELSAERWRHSSLQMSS